MGIKNTTISFALIMIFAVAIVGFGVAFANTNGATISLGDDDELSALKSNSESDAIKYTTEINGSLKAYSESEIVEGAETLVKGNVFKEKDSSPLSAFVNIIDVVKSKIFGGDSTFKFLFTTIISTVLLIATWYSWKLWKGGNPE